LILGAGLVAVCKHLSRIFPKKIGGGTPGYRIADDTRFKYLLAHAVPSARLTERLWRILENHPEIYRSVCNYIRRYKKLPRIPAAKLVEQIKENSLYQSVRAEFIDAADGRLPKSEHVRLAKFLRKNWTPRSLHPDLLARMGYYLIRAGYLNAHQVSYICSRARSWWTRAILIEKLGLSSVSNGCLQAIVELGIHDRVSDAALASAWKIFLIGLHPSGQRKSWNPSGEILLRELGLVQRVQTGYCGIKNSFTKFYSKIPHINWKRLFGGRYAQAERQVVETVAASGVNITGFVNLLDVFNDLLLSAVFAIDGTIGKYNLGGIGSALNPSSRFARKFPATFRLASEVHNMRYGSMYSHPLIRNTGKPTGKISYNFLPRAKRLVGSAVTELLANGLG